MKSSNKVCFDLRKEQTASCSELVVLETFQLAPCSDRQEDLVLLLLSRVEEFLQEHTCFDSKGSLGYSRRGSWCSLVIF